MAEVYALENIARTTRSAILARTRIRPYIYTTPLIPATGTQRINGPGAYYKAENLQRMKCSKVRGILSALAICPPSQSLVTSCHGKHATSAHRAAKTLERDLLIGLPVSTSREHLENLRQHGRQEVVFGGENTRETEQLAREYAEATDHIFLSSYNDPEVIAGQATIALEILEQIEQVDNIFIPMDDEGLVAGIGSVIKTRSPMTKVYGITFRKSASIDNVPSSSAGLSFTHGYADSLIDALERDIGPASNNLPSPASVVDEVLVCGKKEVRDALESMAQEENLLVDASAALAVAGYQKVAKNLADQISVIILNGANFEKRAAL